MASCPHVEAAHLRRPTQTDPVYREDCTLCFDSIDDPDGLDVCLHCYNGGCAGPRHHSQLHASQAQHPLAVNIRRTRKRKHREEPPQKLSKLAIAAETEADRYDTVTAVRCFDCDAAGLDKVGNVADVVDAVLHANTFAQQEEVKAWELELIPCEHTLCLEQGVGRSIASGDLGHCNQCDLKENLWLCLTCGNLGCGRKQYGGFGPPGNGHQLDHNKDTGHPVAVKLGSITAEGNADVYCYACDDEHTDPELVAHLAHWGIDIASRVKTEKSMAEMNIEQNLNYDFSMTTADGRELKPLFGAGYTGLRNLGNSCYLNSIIQSLFANPEFSKRYYRPDEPVPAMGKPAEDLEIQLRKIADGLLSGRYGKPDPSTSTNSNDKPEQTWQAGLAPAMLKHLIGRGHAEFSTMRQQDSFELLMHLLKLITRSQQTSRASYKDVSDPVDAFRFVMEQKLQCFSCKKVRYRQDEMENLSVAVPIKRVKQPDTTMTDGPKDAGVEKQDEFEPVTLKQCLDDFTAAEVVELDCPACGNKGFTKQSLFKTFPAILAINARRFEIVNWVPTKQDVPVVVGDGPHDLEPYRSKGKQPDEQDLPEDSDTGAATASTPSFVADETALQQLTAMGFPRVRCEKALHATGNASADMAAAWLFEHMDDPDIDTPVDLGGAASASSSAAADPEKIDNLAAMGFSAPQARQALKETGGDMERAVEWICSHPDAIGDFGDDEVDPGAAGGAGDAGGAADAKAPPEEDSRPARFTLQSIVCHKGASIHAGHYVAFVKKPVLGSEPGSESASASRPDGGQKERWVLFNDEKVAEGGDAEEMVRFAYVYFFRRSAA